MTSSDRTARLIEDAIATLSAGQNVLLVAHPGEAAELLYDRVIEAAKDKGVVCRNLNPEDSGAPWVEYRPFGPCAMTFSRSESASTRVLIDQSAVFERLKVRPPAVRSVLA